MIKDFMYSKYIPLGLFSAFCLKALFLGLSQELVICLGVLGGVSFLYELFIQNKQVKNLEEKLHTINKQLDDSKKDIEQTKAYISSLKLNNIRAASNGFNRPA